MGSARLDMTCSWGPRIRRGEARKGSLLMFSGATSAVFRAASAQFQNRGVWRTIVKRPAKASGVVWFFLGLGCGPPKNEQNRLPDMVNLRFDLQPNHAKSILCYESSLSAVWSKQKRTMEHRHVCCSSGRLPTIQPEREKTWTPMDTFGEFSSILFPAASLEGAARPQMGTC